MRRERRPKKRKKPPKWQEHVDHMSLWFAMGLAPVVQPWVLIGAGSLIVGLWLIGKSIYLIVS